MGGADARRLLAHSLGCSHAWLAAHGEVPLSRAQADGFADLVARRAEGWPVAYLTGSREFYGRSFAVAPGVLIPRPETELLVELALAQAAGVDAPRLLDLGCGCGCIAITLVRELPRAEVTAVDVSAQALALAARNAASHGAALRLLASDWFASLCGERFDLIVSNPPYVAEGDPHLADLRFEPRLALVAAEQGLAAIRRIVAGAKKHLVAGGALLLEHGYDQAGAVRELLAEAGYADIEQRADLAGILRVSRGRLTQAAAALYNPD